MLSSSRAVAYLSSLRDDLPVSLDVILNILQYFLRKKVSLEVSLRSLCLFKFY